MMTTRSRFLCRLLFSVPLILLSFSQRAGASSTFTITATDVTMPKSGIAFSQYTITNIPISGLLTLRCGYSGSLELGNLPVCPLTPPIAYSVSEGGSLAGQVAFYPPNVAIPAVTSTEVMLIASVLVWGLGLCRRGGRWLGAAALVFAALGASMLISACSGGSSMLMPHGKFPYTITATVTPGGSGPTVETWTTISVTTP